MLEHVPNIRLVAGHDWTILSVLKVILEHEKLLPQIRARLAHSQDPQDCQPLVRIFVTDLFHGVTFFICMPPPIILAFAWADFHTTATRAFLFFGNLKVWKFKIDHQKIANFYYLAKDQLLKVENNGHKNVVLNSEVDRLRSGFLPGWPLP